MSLSRALLLKSGIVFAGCTLAATLVLEKDDPPGNVVEPATHAKRPAPGRSAPRADAPGAAALDPSRLKRMPTTELEENLFALPRPPAPPAPPPPRARAAEAPPKPTAPPLPFRFLGTILDQGVTTLFLADETQNYTVKPGEVIRDHYRLEQLTETQATFVYLPLSERQTLAIGSRN